MSKIRVEPSFPAPRPFCAWASKCCPLCLAVLAACSAPKRDLRPVFPTDDRYQRQIEFSALDLRVPLRDRTSYFRFDGAVADMDKHLQKIFDELGIRPRVTMTSPARFGRNFLMSFRGGERASIAFVLEDEDGDLELAREHHESFHALCALQPESVELVTQRVNELGYAVDLQGYDEELACVILEVLALYLAGNEIVIGTGRTMDAVMILQKAKIKLE